MSRVILCCILLFSFIFFRYASTLMATTVFWMGEPLQVAYEEAKRQAAFLSETTKYRDMKLSNDCMMGYIGLLLGLTPSEDSFVHDDVVEDEKELIAVVMMVYLCHKVFPSFSILYPQFSIFNPSIPLCFPSFSLLNFRSFLADKHLLCLDRISVFVWLLRKGPGVRRAVL